MNTTVIKADAKTRIKVMEVVEKKLHKPLRPVTTFLDDDDRMVISGCTTSEFCSALSEHLGKMITIVRASNINI